MLQIGAHKGSRVRPQVPEGAGPARLERTGLTTLQRFLADGQAIRAHRQGMAGGARDDQLVSFTRRP